MTQNTKRIILFSFIGALASLVLLSASLSNLQFHDGTPLPGGGNSAANTSPFTALTSAYAGSPSLLQEILAFLFLIIALYLPLKFLTLIDLKRVFQWLFAMFLLLALIILLPHVTPGPPSPLPAAGAPATLPPSFKYTVSPLGSPPQELVWIVLSLIVFGGGLLAIRMLKLWPQPEPIKTQISNEAESAVKAIKLGNDLREVIIHCYLQMANAIHEEQKIERGSSMTAREFEDRLGLKGFPLGPVHQLTDLFEKARYASQSMVEDDEKTAVKSLNEIIRFCRGGRD